MHVSVVQELYHSDEAQLQNNQMIHHSLLPRNIDRMDEDGKASNLDSLDSLRPSLVSKLRA